MSESQHAAISSENPRSTTKKQPHKFPNIYAEAGFCFTLCITQFLAEYLISGFALQLPLISEQNPDIQDGGTSALWPASLLSLVMSATLLIFARLSDMFGGYWSFMFGLVWLTIWTLIPGLTTSSTALSCARAMQGLALAAFMPSTFAILGKLYVPGRRKTVIISIYSAFNCLGFFGGFIVAGALGIDHSQWYFFIGAILAALTTLTAWLTIPRKATTERNRNVSMDWLGSLFIVSGLLLLSYALAAEPNADEHSKIDGFATAVVLGPLVAGVSCLIAAVLVEWMFAKSPLVPLTFFNSWSVVSLSLACMCFYACFGIWLYYTVEYFQNPIANTSNLAGNQITLALWYLPMAIAGLICCVLIEPLLHVVHMKILLIGTALLWIAAPVILAASPLPLNYWANAFPSVLCATAGINLTFTISIVYLTAVQPSESQGLCGAMCSIFLGLAFAFSLPVGQIVMTKVSGRNWMIDSPMEAAAYDHENRESMILGYRAAFVYAAVSAGLGLVLCAFGVSVPRVLRKSNKEMRDENIQRYDSAETGSS